MLKTPESYLAILAESSQPRYHLLADKPNMHERQNLALLDALAEICVSQEGETYASALELNVERCSLFIVGNQEQVPQCTQEYLADLCRRLTNIANVADARRPSDKDFPPMIRDSIDEIYRTVLSFTFPKLLARLTKWNDSWCDRIVDIDEIQLAEADRKKFGDLTQALNSLYRVATNFKDPLDVEDTKILDNIVGSVSEEWYLNNPDTATFVHMLDALPTNDGNSTPFSIERYLQKILKTYDQTTKLVDFALSSRHGCIFQNQPELVFLNSQARHVELNIQGAINKVELQMITTREDKVYFDRLKDRQLEERWKFQRPEPIIGISTLSCFGCRLYFMAYSYARLRLTGSDLPMRFAITGARNTADVPWVSPDLTAIDPGLHAGIQRRLLTLVQEASTAHSYYDVYSGMMVAHDVYPRHPCDGVRSPKEMSSITSASRVRRLYRDRVEPMVSDKYLGTINERPNDISSMSQRSAQNDAHIASQNIIVRPQLIEDPPILPPGVVRRVSKSMPMGRL